MPKKKKKMCKMRSKKYNCETRTCRGQVQVLTRFKDISLHLTLKNDAFGLGALKKKTAPEALRVQTYKGRAVRKRYIRTPRCAGKPQ